METDRYVPEMSEEVENPVDRKGIAEIETLLHLARLVGLRTEGDDYKLR